MITSLYFSGLVFILIFRLNFNEPSSSHNLENKMLKNPKACYLGYDENFIYILVFYKKALTLLWNLKDMHPYILYFYWNLSLVTVKVKKEGSVISPFQLFLFDPFTPSRFKFFFPCLKVGSAYLYSCFSWI